MISDADTVGVFQIESRAQMSMLPRLQPRKFYDLVIEVAIVRPGPIQGKMVHPYLQNRERLRADPTFEVSYPSDALREVLKETLGVPLFQEQAMRLAVVAAGFTATEADALRRAMAAWKRHGGLGHLRDKFINGMLTRGYQPDFAEKCFQQISGFGQYGFPESHAASFARLVYASAWLKRHHPAAFAAALINSQPMGFYAPAQIVRDAREHGVPIRPIDINASHHDCTLEYDAPEITPPANDVPPNDTPPTNTPPTDAPPPPHDPTPISPRLAGGRASHAEQPTSTPHPTLADSYSSPLPRASPGLTAHRSTWGHDGPALRLGFRLIKGFRKSDADRIVLARETHGPFTSVAELQRLAQLDRATIDRLARADAFASLGLSRRQASWHALALAAEPIPLTEEHDQETPAPAQLPLMPLVQEVFSDYSTTSLSLKRHPVSFARSALAKLKVTTALSLQDATRFPHGSRASVAGLVLVRQRPGTASGVVFITLEDETGTANLILWSAIYERYRLAARHATLLLADGLIQREGKVIHLLARRLTDRTDLIPGVAQKSRDFH
jgi:error-prone DNA polymerase